MMMADTMDELAQKYVISVEGLSKRFGGKQVLSNISFTVEQGSIFALIGPKWCWQDDDDTLHNG